MPPETPKRSADKSVSLTPSFTFGLGNSPSIRFTSPRGLNILSSLSPHRFFAKSSKDSYKPTPDSASTDHSTSASTKESTENDTTFESARTSDSVEIWSLADDSQNLSMNLTSINEESDKDVYFSPNEFLFGPLFTENAEGNTSSESLQKKRKLSVSEDSPCKKLASCIETLKSPDRKFSDDSHLKSPNKNKVWTVRLDEELLRCHAKYSAFKASHAADPAIFKYTSQNKILSRMLLNKTGILRSAKQISTRLSKLVKNATPQINSFPDSLLPKAPSSKDVKSSAVAVSPHVSNDTLAPARLQEMNLSFKYLDVNQGSHIFTIFEAENIPEPQTHTFADLKKILPNQSAIFLHDLDKISRGLAKSKTGICNVNCQVNFNSEFNAASSPVSPMTDPRQFTMANGNFSSSLLVKIPTNEGSDSCRSLISSTTIYKGSEKVLHRSKEMVNGFLNHNQDLEVEVPFMNKFWSGYLGYLSNGTQDYQDLENLIISQTIHEKDEEEAPFILLVFTFAPAKTQHGSATASLHLLQEENSKVDEADELETMVMSSPILASSPFVASPGKPHFHVNTNFSPNDFPQGPNSAPIYNSNLLQTFSKNNYPSGMHAKPPMQHSKSTTFIGSKTLSPSGIPHGQQMQGNLVRHNSAGQVPTNASINIQGTSFDMTHDSHVAMQQVPVPGSVINAPPMAYFHHPQPPQFTNANNAPLRQNWVPLPEQHPMVQSAPPSQLGFTSMHTPPQEPGSESKPVGIYKQRQGVTFGPILSYDPSQSLDRPTPQPSESSGSGYQHRFSVPPREIFQPHNMR